MLAAAENRLLEDIKELVNGFGVIAGFLFVVIQVLQVVVLPIPSIITVTAGALTFGPVKGECLVP